MPKPQQTGVEQPYGSAGSGRNLTKLNERTRRLCTELRDWSPERLQFRPDPESWSALQLLDHLVLTERAVLAGMRRNLNSGNCVTFRDFYRNAFLLGIMLLPTRLRVPGSVDYLLPSNHTDNLSTLLGKWAGDRKMLAAFLASLSSANQKKGVFRHPVGGWTTPNGALLFLRAHLYHHLYQFARIREASNTLVRSSKVGDEV